MADALEAGYDLGGLAGCYIAIGLLSIVAFLANEIAKAFDFSLFGYRPLHGIANAIRNYAVAGIDQAIKATEKQAAKFESGLIDALGIMLGLAVLLGEGVQAALSYLWNHALDPRITRLLNPVGDLAAKAAAGVERVASDLTHEIAAAKRYAQAQALGALAAATAYVDTRVAAAERAAVSYADQAVGRLRSAEEAALAAALVNVGDAIRAGEQAAESEIDAARREAAQALGQADAAFRGALGTVEGIAEGALNDLGQIVGPFGVAGAAGLLASIPALATLVQAIATEAGLESAECRGKVKQVCGTDPNAWAGLLAGLAPLGFALSLHELYAVARPLVAELAPLVAEAA